MAEDHVKINLDGIAGQGLGAFIEQGLTLRAHGANDGVGKSLSGGKIVISADEASPIAQNPQDNVLIGQFALFGATKGELFVAGKAGNRFAIRNSGGLAVVEGMQDNGCNYQTNGRIVCLGEVGHNFGAGMTGVMPSSMISPTRWKSGRMMMLFFGKLLQAARKNRISNFWLRSMCARPDRGMGRRYWITGRIH